MLRISELKKKKKKQLSITEKEKEKVTHICPTLRCLHGVIMIFTMNPCSKKIFNVKLPTNVAWFDHVLPYIWN